MPIQHAKSPCCQGVIYRFGNRRRQCASCRRTWSIRSKKRGRKPLRVSAKLARQYLTRGLPSLPILAQQRQLSVRRIRHRLCLSRTALLQSDSFLAPPPDVPLLAIADAIWQWIDRKKYTIFIILLKPLGSNQAIICPPLLCAGHETPGWSAAFAKLPREWHNRIFALICDGNVGLISQAYQNHWLLQRCHAHLRRWLNNYLSDSPLSRHRQAAEDVHRLVTVAITTRNRLELAHTVLELREIYQATTSRWVRKVISGFLKHVREYRTYLEHEEFDLPTTTNAVESLNSLIRELQYKSRGFSSPDALLQWITALLVIKQTMLCNGSFQQKK